MVRVADSVASTAGTTVKAFSVSAAVVIKLADVFHSQTAKRTFSVAPSNVWNSLPIDIGNTSFCPLFITNSRHFLFLHMTRHTHHSASVSRQTPWHSTHMVMLCYVSVFPTVQQSDLWTVQGCWLLAGVVWAGVVLPGTSMTGSYQRQPRTS